jgi:hypothetical protein
MLYARHETELPQPITSRNMLIEQGLKGRFLRRSAPVKSVVLAIGGFLKPICTMC